MVSGRSRYLALAGLAALGALLLLPPTPAGALAAAPLGAAALVGLRAPARWGVPVAVLLLPYFAWGVMMLLTDPAGRVGAILFSGLTVTTFLAAMDDHRRG